MWLRPIANIKSPESGNQRQTHIRWPTCACLNTACRCLLITAERPWPPAAPLTFSCARPASLRRVLPSTSSQSRLKELSAYEQRQAGAG